MESLMATPEHICNAGVFHKASSAYLLHKSLGGIVLCLVWGVDHERQVTDTLEKVKFDTLLHNIMH